MPLNVKYQYTHFIYPFVVEDKDYNAFIASILKQDKKWNLNIHSYEKDKESYDFFLPYMKRFLFPTLFWNKQYEKQFLNMNFNKKVLIASRLSCVTFEYQLSNIKTGSIKASKKFRNY